MAKYRKKPVVIEAFQWFEEMGEIGSVVAGLKSASGGRVYVSAAHGFGINTLEGWLHVTDGDWIIRGIAGECYPCKPTIFEATYEPMEPADEPAPPA